MKKLTALILGVGAVTLAGYVFRAELEDKILKLIEASEAFITENHLLKDDSTDEQATWP